MSDIKIHKGWSKELVEEMIPEVSSIDTGVTPIYGHDPYINSADNTFRFTGMVLDANMKKGDVVNMRIKPSKVDIKNIFTGELQDSEDSVIEYLTTYCKVDPENDENYKSKGAKERHFRYPADKEAFDRFLTSKLFMLIDLFNQMKSRIPEKMFVFVSEDFDIDIIKEPKNSTLPSIPNLHFVILDYIPEDSFSVYPMVDLKNEDIVTTPPPLIRSGENIFAVKSGDLHERNLYTFVKDETLSFSKEAM